MKIVSSILPNEDLQKELMGKFPQGDFYFYRGIDEAEAEFANADIFITYGNDVTDEHISKATQLKWIMVMSAGVEDMPLHACEQKGIVVTNARGIHKIPMAEYTIGIMLQHEKRWKQLWTNEKDEIWDRKLPFGELNGKTVLILGTGAIGGEIARLCQAFQMYTIGLNRSGDEVAYFDRILKLKDMANILPQVDYLVSILPSTKETKNLIKKDHFLLMKESAVFCNIGRGDVVDERVLLEALKNREIAHAFLDVFSEEPLPSEHPFWKMDNVTVSPHISSISKKYLPRAFAIFEHNLHAYTNNEKLMNKIDYKKGY